MVRWEEREEGEGRGRRERGERESHARILQNRYSTKLSSNLSATKNVDLLIVLVSIRSLQFG